METTQNDLSYGHVKLDYDALVQTSQFAVGLLRQQINDYLSKSIELSGKVCPTYANMVKTTAKRFAIAVETYQALYEGKIRTKKELINIPDIPDEEKQEI